MNKLIVKRKSFFFLVLLTPVFWWSVFNFSSFIDEWLKLPSYTNNKLSTIYSEGRVLDLSNYRGNSYSRLYYNKITILADEFFGYTTFLSPRIYFQAGDGGKLSPPRIEPIPFLLFPLWVIGLLKIFREKNFKLITLLLLAPLPAFLSGQKNFYFLWPVIFLYIYISYLVLESFKSKKYVYLVSIYSLYLIGRMIWLQT